MPSFRTRLPWFVAGAVVGGLAGGVAGYVINDLTSKPNEAVVADIEAQRQTQQNLDNFFEQLADAPAGDPDSGN